MEGLDIGLTEFKRMRSLDRDISIFNNLKYMSKKLDDHQIKMEKKFTDYKFHKKIQYVWMSVLTTGVLILLGFKKFGVF